MRIFHRQTKADYPYLNPRQKIEFCEVILKRATRGMSERIMLQTLLTACNEVDLFTGVCYTLARQQSEKSGFVKEDFQ